MSKTADDKRPYESPTTPGLYVTLFDFIVELVCLNMNSNLGPKFWSNNEYWKKKYIREISRGIQKLKELFVDFDLENPIIRIALIRTFKCSNIQSLLREKTRKFILRKFKKEYELLSIKHKQKINKLECNPIDQEKNLSFIDLPQETDLGKIRKLEDNG